MTGLFSALRSPWLLRLAGAIILGLVIWFAGPLLAFADYHPLDREWVRIALIVLLIAFWLIRHGVRQVRNRLGNRRMFDVLMRHAQDSAKGESASSQANEIRARFEKAATLLRDRHIKTTSRSKSWLDRLGGRRYAYQLPWYLFIGAPGSGKTTALTHSGLQFPLADALGNAPLRGIGGTRNCEWWITDRAVLIDTAGRYTTQDSNAPADAAEWRQFIDIIKRFRPRQPINGVLATVSVSDLLGSHVTSAEMERQADALRARITELQHHVGHPFPVYLLVTKTDLLPGFTQFFEDLNREQREQVWGCTFSMKSPDDAGSPVAQLGPQLQTLEERLFAQLLPRLQAGRDNGMRTLIYGFPGQWVQLKEAVAGFVERAFSPSGLTRAIWLRGVYFTSGTQEATPIDRVLGALSRSYGIQRTPPAAQRPTGKSFFITRLLKDMVFAEAGLAGVNLLAEARMQRMKWAGMAAGGMAALLAIGIWTLSYFNNSNYIVDVATGASTFKKSLILNSPAKDDIPGILALLDAVRDLPRTQDVDPKAPGFLMRTGLFQGEKMQAGAEQAYDYLLATYLAPLVSRRIESGLRQADNPERQYETLKAYLMLHRQGNLDADALKAWIIHDLEADNAKPLTAETRQQLLRHVDVLLKREAIGPDTPPDPDLVARVRQAQLQVPFVQRVYNRIRHQDIQGRLPDFRLTDAGGPNSQIVFSRRSGQSLADGVPGLYTYKGYYEAFNPQVDASLRQLAEEEAWVLGVPDSENARRAGNPVTRPALADEVRRLYLQDYAQIWERYIADIGLVKTRNLAQSVEQTKILSGPDSPLPRVLTAIVREVTLSDRPAAGLPQSGKAGGLVTQGRQKLNSLLGEAARQAPPADEPRVEAIVDDRFNDLRRFVRSPAPNQAAPADGALKLINELYMLLSATERALKAGNPLPRSDVPDKVRAEAVRMPEPVRSMVIGLANDSRRLAFDVTTSSLQNPFFLLELRASKCPVQL